MQDTINQKLPVRPDTLKKSEDSASGQHKISPYTLFVKHEIIPVKKEADTSVNTTSLFNRNPVTGITFYDSANVISRTDSAFIDRFPFVFNEMNLLLQKESRTELVKHLRDGTEIPKGQYDIDWILPLCLLSAFLYAFLRATSGNIFNGLMRFISFRGISESGSRIPGELFQWQSTILNFASFINLSLFVYLSTINYNLQFPGIHGIFIWLICFAIVIAATTIRHFVCISTGKASGEAEIFREYLVGIYQAYRIAGLISFLLILLIVYTTLVPNNIFFYAGFAAIGILYMARVLRLFLIFINRHVSIFYLILYLCALEILPVVILIKYVTGLV